MTMAVDNSPKHIDTTRVIFKPSGDAALQEVTPDFYAKLEQFGDFMGHTLIQQFHFDEPWGTWEMHPHGDEFVLLVSGDTSLQLKMPGQTATEVRVNTPGTYVMVPKGAWHTAIPHAPTTMLFVTPGAGTLNQDEPE